MSRLILFSVNSSQSRINFGKTVLNGISADCVQKYLDKSMAACDYAKNLHFWGCKASKYYEKKINKISKGDTILFSMNKQFIAECKIISVLKSKELSSFLWNDMQFSNILLVSEIKSILIPYDTMFSAIGYSPKAKINGLVFVDNKKLSEIKIKYGGIESYIHDYAV